MVIPAPPVGRGRKAAMSVSTATSTVYLLGAQFLRNLGPLIILLLLARLTTPETVGTYSLSLALVTPFFVFAQLGMRTVTLTLQPEARFRHYTLVQATAVAGALVAALIFGSLASAVAVLILACAGLSKVSDNFADFVSGSLQRHDRARTVFVGSLLSAALVSITTAVVIYATRNLTASLTALAVSSLICTYVLLFRPARRVTAGAEDSVSYHAPEAGEIRRIVLAGLPLGVAMSLMSLISTVPQYIVTSAFGEAETARLAVLLYIYALADIVTGVVSQAWIPQAQRLELHTHRSARLLAVTARHAGSWTIAYVPITAVGLILASVLIPLVFGPTYTLSLLEAVPLGFAVVLLPAAHFLATAVAIRNDYAHTLTLAVGSTALSLAACIVLIPSMGLAGAFWAVMVAVASRAALAAVILALRGRKETRR